MLNNENTTRGFVKSARMAIALIAATVFLGGSLTEASAKSRHHRHKHHHAQKHHHHAHKAGVNWMKAFASLPSSTGGRSFSGIASFYGSGARTASGARFSPGGLTCAHRSLPFGTRLRVTHAGRSVVVTVNDRGPFIRGRVLDLSTGAARAVGLTSRGVGRVVAEVM